MTRKLSTIKILFVLAALGAAVLAYFVYSGLKGWSSLRAEYSVEKADIGIPGISKMYDARVINRGKLPVRVQVCDFVDDASARGQAAAFAVQKWDSHGNKWVTVMDASNFQNCRPYPLGWVTANLKRIWLWPGQSVSMGEEATAARGFHQGDSARFVLYSGFNETGKTTAWAFPTASFVIDEEALPDGPELRIRH